MRSGTHLTIDTIRRNFPAYDLPRQWLQGLDAHYISVDVLMAGYRCPQAIKDRELHKLRSNSGGILKTHYAQPDYGDVIEEHPSLQRLFEEQCRTVYVIRDPVRVLQSLYTFESTYKPINDFDTWLNQSIDRWDRHVQQRVNLPHVLTIRFEDLVSAPGDALQDIAGWLNSQPVVHDRILPRQMKSRALAWLTRFYLRGYESTEVKAPRGSLTLTATQKQAIAAAVQTTRPEAALRFGYLAASKAAG